MESFLLKEVLLTGKSTFSVAENCPGRAGCCLPAPPQTRTSGFSASGSSAISFAKKEYKNDK